VLIRGVVNTWPQLEALIEQEGTFQGERSHRVLEDPVPLREDQVRRQNDAAPLVTLSQQREEHLHFVPVVLHIADVVQNQTRKAVETGQFARQAQVALGGQQLLHQGRRARPQHRVALPDQLVAYCRRKVAFSSSMRRPS